MTSPDDATELEQLLEEQAAYYRAVAPEYRDHVLPFPGEDELSEAIDAFQPAGDVLELACGPGTWTGRLLSHAQHVTAVDASAEMLALASARFDDERVRFVRADVFDWTPDRRYDVVFLGFWLSHVPHERFESFWSLVAGCLEPAGRVLFVDDGHRTPDELVEGEWSPVIRRTLADGTHHRVVKIPFRPADLEQRLAHLGWDVRVTATSGPFFWGAGGRRS
ncbi:demethylmenaquinone methyltransferase/2-methoxy-6-polyprenyl-1,4-benzoquinol methylase [Saccharopolyspora lacisalsi]|uniref:Demethylmenaquinone methyltransferase/2-methoxy-6-polyprenyl-1,4-benzoquinol methylase n=1 Tax=Halosaccharopolyspora lacisalsi TaxID=1000566 RepID=A0A839DZW0_9PSEU|nr:class I SAM-dependent methyltransferase [Halosaccharopolyspora lacisalsi]MBA8824751.1 demethylmenaquinone methyltransferase/2-methoxy-6-polyprenyl-1,4-benzoquinol methylase [Halosaccharopolyspora lacisalsi]